MPATIPGARKLTSPPFTLDPTVTNDWSRRAQLQRIVNGRGSVLPFARYASPEHRAVGW
jgi:hypothetical protein